MLRRGGGCGEGRRGAGFRLGGPRRGRLPSLRPGPSGSDTARERACESPEEVGWPSRLLGLPRLPRELGVSPQLREQGRGAAGEGLEGGMRAGSEGLETRSERTSPEPRAAPPH